MTLNPTIVMILQIIGILLVVSVTVGVFTVLFIHAGKGPDDEREP